MNNLIAFEIAASQACCNSWWVPLGFKSYFGRVAEKALWVQAIKGPSHADRPTASDRVLPGWSVLRFHVDLPSNGWPRQGQIGEVQHQGRRGTDYFKKKTPFKNILAIFLPRNFWDVAFTCVLQLAPKCLSESTVLNLSCSESSVWIDALAWFALWYLILYSVSWLHFWYFTFCLEFESSSHWKETQRKHLRTPKAGFEDIMCFVLFIF